MTAARVDRPQLVTAAEISARISAMLQGGAISPNQARQELGLDDTFLIMDRENATVWPPTASCSYCRSDIDPGQPKCPTCGAPRQEPPSCR